MYKFWFVRMRDNSEATWDHHSTAEDIDAPHEFENGWGGLGDLWTRMWWWMLGRDAAGVLPLRVLAADERERAMTKLRDSAADIRAASLEPPRIGAAYTLAAAATGQHEQDGMLLASLARVMVEGEKPECTQIPKTSQGSRTVRVDKLCNYRHV